MIEHGFIKIAACTPQTTIADATKNSECIIDMIRLAQKEGVVLAVFPELAITGYTCADLFFQKLLLDEALSALLYIIDKTKEYNVASVIGLPLVLDNRLYNAAAVICKGKLLGICTKTYIPNYNEFYEKRWFSSAADITCQSITLPFGSVLIGNDLVFENTAVRGLVFSVEICEDLWAPIPPSIYHTLAGSMIVLNPSASNELVGKADYRKNLIKNHSARTISGYVYASSGIGESSTDTVYGGHGIIAEYGQILAESQRFQTDAVMTISQIDIFRLENDRLRNSTFMEHEGVTRTRRIRYESAVADKAIFARSIDPHPFIPSDRLTLDERCKEIFSIQTSGLYKRMDHTGIKKAVLGISGGLDSTLALLVTIKAFKKLGYPVSDIIAVTMPGFGTSDETYKNALWLIEKTGAKGMEISIKEASQKHFEDIGHDQSVHNTVYENVQARERTMLLMNIANKENGLVVGTGDLSEIALGWSTYNGDHMSMYAVNCGVPKTLVKFLIDWIARNEADDELAKLLGLVIATPISPELLPPDIDGMITQKTEDMIGPYELHDFFLYHMMRFGFGPKKILFLAKEAFLDKYEIIELRKWLKVFYTRFFQSQYKRSCIPDGPKVGTVALSPRADLRMPSDASFDSWLNELLDVSEEMKL